MTRSFAIVTEASCDLPPERVQVPGVAVVPLPIIVGGQSYDCYPDERELKLADFYAMLRDKQRVSTAAPSPQAFAACAEPFLCQGMDVLYIGLASTLSGTYGAGELAMRDLAVAYPERRIRCVDSHSGSQGEGLLVEMAIEARAQGMSMDDTARLIEEKRSQVLHCFTVQDLHYIARSGRLSGYAALLGSLLSFKPILWLNREGVIKVIGRARGMRKAMNTMVDMVKDKALDLAQQCIYISHADVGDLALELVERLREVGAVCFVVHRLGPAIGAHGGPGSLAVFWLGAGR